jgi:hypothetical protein
MLEMIGRRRIKSEETKLKISKANKGKRFRTCSME